MQIARDFNQASIYGVATADTFMNNKYNKETNPTEDLL
jgi:hypothetical protein